MDPSRAAIGQAAASLAVGLANPTDIEQIVRLMADNQAERGGSLSALYSPEQVAGVLQRMPLIVARCAGEVIGFLMTSPVHSPSSPPILRAMLQAYRGEEDAYVYGPICVAEPWRGRGLAQAMFAELRRALPGREGILFIRDDNAASLHAHAKMGMTEVARFTFQGVPCTVLSFRSEVAASA